VEDLISTRRIKADYFARTGRHCEVAEIAAFVPTDPDAHAIFDLFGQHLGEVLRDVVAPFHPDSVVIGGGISRSANLFLPRVEKLVADLGFLERAALVGAAYNWRELSRKFAQPASAPSALWLSTSSPN
jgi:glucokinase